MGDRGLCCTTTGRGLAAWPPGRLAALKGGDISLLVSMPTPALRLCCCGADEGRGGGAGEGHETAIFVGNLQASGVLPVAGAASDWALRTCSRLGVEQGRAHASSQACSLLPRQPRCTVTEDFALAPTPACMLAGWLAGWLACGLATCAPHFKTEEAVTTPPAVVDHRRGAGGPLLRARAGAEPAVHRGQGVRQEPGDGDSGVWLP